MKFNCLLCLSENTSHLVVEEKPKGNYFHCRDCDFIFRAPIERLNPSQEKDRYELHENIDTPGYRKFLEPVVQSVLSFQELDLGWGGLDYGCGPSQFLAKCFLECGILIQNYDPLFFPNKDVLKSHYDFITATEVMEHMYNPRKSISEIRSLLKPNGFFLAMTSNPPSVAHFKTWSYRRDETHVGFFSSQAFQYISSEWGFKIIEHSESLWVLQCISNPL